MDEIVENEVLEDLFNARSDGFQARFVREYGETDEMRKVQESENKLIDMIKTNINNDKIQKQIIKQFYEVTDNMTAVECFWMKQYYKLGFVDRASLKKLKVIKFFRKFRKK